MKYLLVMALVVLAACEQTVSTAPGGPTRAIVAHGGGNVFTASSSGVQLHRSFAQPMQLAGGRSARILTVASAETDADASLRDLFMRAGYRNVYHLNVRDPQAIAEISQADVIYFDGGVQTRLMRKLNAHPGVRDAILARYQQGAVIAGVSAGAAVMSDLMICCDRGGQAVPSRGLGLLPNIVIDQHYSERNRQFRLDQIISNNSTLIGVGIDEEMSVVFSGDQMRIVGSGGGVTIVRSTDGGDIERIRRTGGTVNLSALRAAFANASPMPISVAVPARSNIINRPIIIDANSALFCRDAQSVQQTIAANTISSLRAGRVASLAAGCTIHRGNQGPYGPVDGRTSNEIATTQDGQRLFVTTTASSDFSYTFVGDL